uniref:Uncharacterized protein n=1 Tax=Syphacia muris TaxID=451379 RepID=A0A0N5AK64_9BILA
MRALTSVGILLLCLTLIDAQKMIRQCSCQEYRSCQKNILKNIFPCADKCQKHVAAIGVNYKVIRQCLASRANLFEAALKCSEAALPNGCTNGPPRMIPKRYKNGLEIALMTEGNRIIQNSGVQMQVTPLLSVAKKFGQCTWSCVNKKTQFCGDLSKCGLDLPSDTQVVATLKQCAINSGLLATSTIQELCQCAINAGLR